MILCASEFSGMSGVRRICPTDQPAGLVRNGLELPPSTPEAPLPAAEKTGNYTIRPNSIVHSIIFDEQNNRAKGVLVNVTGSSSMTMDDYQEVARIVHETRTDRRVAVGASPRGSLAFLKMARANAVLDGRDFVLPDDIKRFAAPVLSHRLILQPEYWMSRSVAGEVIDGVFDRVRLGDACVLRGLLRRVQRAHGTGSMTTG